MPQLVCNVVEVYVFRPVADGPEFLLLQRRPGDFMGDTWHPVSGKIEAGETAVAAARRELREEAGLTPLRFWQVDAVNPFYIAKFDAVVLSICFAAEVASDAQPQLSDEHADFRWVRAAEVDRALMWPGQRRTAHEIIDEIITPGPGEPHLRLPP